MTEQERVERVAKTINGPHDATHIGEEKLRELQDHKWDKQTTKHDRASCLRKARAAIAAMRKDAAMDALVAEGQRCDATTPQCIHMTSEMAANCPTCNPSALRGLPIPTPQEAAKVSAEARENIVDEIESIICETHEMDVRDVDYAENIVSWLERHHPAALCAISEDSHE